jgi:mannose-6-phosphate isomerase-like protein (cupin superfamily)
MIDEHVFDAAARARFDPAKMAKVGLYDSPHLMLGLNCFEPGQKHALHAHGESDKIYAVVAGRARLTLGEESSDLEAGAVAVAPAGVPHAVENSGPARLVLLVVMAPPPHRS